MRAFRRYRTTGSYFQKFRSYVPTKISNLTYFLLIFFFFLNLYLTYDMMTRQKFYI
ncbi:hypothetical protein O3M35_005214 [Rhynocoris fuscipes]|uniref:Uncharacterized protein n=1 Tax=Rhynocoris fuscipes TaxID=488301 RepID=A0AAW1DMR4_9HEMI